MTENKTEYYYKGNRIFVPDCMKNLKCLEKKNKTENKTEYYYKGNRIFVPDCMKNLKCLEKKEK